MGVSIEKSELQREMSKMVAQRKAKSRYGETPVCVAHNFDDF